MSPATVTLEDRARQLVADTLLVDVKDCKDDARLVDDLEADSLEVVQLIMTVEAEFNVEVPDEDATKLATVGDVVAYVARHAKT